VSELYKNITVCEVCMSDFKNKILSFSRHRGPWSGGEAAHVKDVDLRGKGKGKVRPGTGHEGPEGE
jgi:hypothetical protein